MRYIRVHSLQLLSLFYPIVKAIVAILALWGYLLLSSPAPEIRESLTISQTLHSEATVYCTRYELVTAMLHTLWIIRKDEREAYILAD